ncbi:MAG: hypothetical protein EB127_29915, partial [Alphaproteobacteria bacterium]|nr:hypothetical protein [Alphaproteobacteria bacterium]
VCARLASFCGRFLLLILMDLVAYGYLYFYKYYQGDYIMAKNRKVGKGFAKGGYRKHRNKKTTSRQGLPKIK